MVAIPCVCAKEIQDASYVVVVVVVVKTNRL